MMNLPSLGALQPDTHLPDWLHSQPIAVPYFNGEKLTFVLTGLTDEDADEAEAAVAAFLALGADATSEAAPYVFKHYRRMADLVGDDEVGCRIENPAGVWAHVHPTDIYVTRRDRRDRAIYVQVGANCDWEQEHGLQIVYRRGNELCRVSGQDGHLTHADAYGLPDDQDRIA